MTYTVRKTRTKTKLLICAALCLPAGAAVSELAKQITPATLFATNHYGTPLAPTVPGIHQRRDCNIGRFGSAPFLAPGVPRDADYHARAERALQVFGLPAGARQLAHDRLAVGIPDREIRIYNDRVDGGPVELNHRYITTYAKDGKDFVCHNSKANFRSNEHSEKADLYVIHFEGRTYYIVEPHACRNLSRMFALLPPGYTPAPPTYWSPQGMQPSAPTPGAQPFVPFDPPPVVPPVVLPERDRVNNVPEPATFALVALAFVLIVFSTRSK